MVEHRGGYEHKEDIVEMRYGPSSPTDNYAWR